MFQRKTSEYIRQSPSVVIVNETRGTFLQIMSILVGMNFITSGIRFIVACEYLFPWEPAQTAELLERAYPNCRTDKYMALSLGFSALFVIMFGIVHLHLATVSHIADFYHAMVLTTIMDTLFIGLMIRFGLDEIPTFWKFHFITLMVYQYYVLYKARRAHVVRLQQKKIKE